MPMSRQSCPRYFFFFFNDTATTEIYTLSLHDALPISPPPPSPTNDPFDPANKVRDLLGSTHHEAGTLWMGASAQDSVADLDGRFHHVANAYTAGPALFPTLGSANPSLTALTLARRTAT